MAAGLNRVRSHASYLLVGSEDFCWMKASGEPNEYHRVPVKPLERLRVACFRNPLAAWGGRTAAQRARCAVFLLQLLSNILKTERGASHPERSNHDASASQAARPTDDSAKAALTSTNDEVGCEWETEAAQACAEASNAYLGRMVQAATALNARSRSDGDGRCGEHVAAVGLDGEDAGFWVFAFLSDVLKCLRKDKWSCGDSTFVTGGNPKRKRDGEATGIKVVSYSPPPPPPPAAEAVGTVDVSDGDGRGSSGLVVDISALAHLVSAFPVGRGKRAMDLALKWLEVTQASVLFCLSQRVTPAVRITSFAVCG